MRPLRFVALSEDGQALVLTDEAGRMLFLTLDESVLGAIRQDHSIAGQLAIEVDASLTPRDIQARIRAGDSVAEVARVANVSVEKVLRFAGPVLQERAAMAELARRTRLKDSDEGGKLGEITDKHLTEHAVDPQKVTWDSFRRENGSWRITATWQSGKATASAVWDLDKGRTTVTAADDMAMFLAADRQTLLEREELSGNTKPRLAASRLFNDDVAEPKEGPTVPAVSMLRRDRAARQQRIVERATGAHPAYVGAQSVPSSERPAIDTGLAPGFIRPPHHERHQEPDQPAREASANSNPPGRISAAEALGLAPPAPSSQPRKRALPTWDDILFGAGGASSSGAES